MKNTKLILISIIVVVLLAIILIVGFTLASPNRVNNAIVEYESSEITMDKSFIDTLHQYAPLKEDDRAIIDDTFGQIILRVHCNQNNRLKYSIYFYEDSHTYYYIFSDKTSGYGYIEDITPIIELVKSNE